MFVIHLRLAVHMHHHLVDPGVWKALLNSAWRRAAKGTGTTGIYFLVLVDL